MRLAHFNCFAALCLALAACGGDPIDKTNNDNSGSPDMGATDTGGSGDTGAPDAGGDDVGTPDDMTGGVGTATVAPTSLQLAEAAGTGTYTVSLSVAPDADVVVDVGVSDATLVSVSPAQLTFTSSGFGPQTVTVTAIDNDQIGGNPSVVLSHTVTASGNYAGVGLAPVTVEVTDDDSPTGTVSPTALSLGEGTAGTFDVSLGVEPTGPVTIALSSDATQVMLDVDELTFEPGNFSVPQTVSVTAIDDDIAEGPMSSLISLSASGGGYDNLVLPMVAVAISDNDVAGIVLSTTFVQTSEDGDTATIDISLQSQPTATVEILVPNSAPTEFVPSPLVLVFDDTNWDVPQTLTLTGVDDALVDGAQTRALILTSDSTDPEYDGLTESIAVTINDNDGATVIVTPLNLTVAVSGLTSETFEVSLSADPGFTVDIGLSSSATNLATVTPASLSFDSSNWNTPQIVTVTAVDNPLCGQGNANVTIETAPIVSAATVWDGIDPPDVSVLVLPGGSCGVTVTPTTGLQVDEAGSTDSFTVVLNGGPSANVTVDFVSSDTTQGTVSPASVTFTPTNWQTAQTVTVTGVDDDCPDGDVLFNIVTSITSTDPVYAVINPTDVFVTNLDDDAPAPIYSPMIGFPHTTTEAGGTASFTIALVPPGCPGPSASVTIPLGVTDPTEASVMPGNLVFTAANADVPQTVTVTGIDDADVDGNVGFLVVTDDIVSQDPYWDGYNPPNVPMQNEDDD